jgi:hypothetical protein
VLVAKFLDKVQLFVLYLPVSKVPCSQKGVKKMFKKIAKENKRRADAEMGMLILLYIMFVFIVIGLEEGVRP